MKKRKEVISTIKLQKIIAIFATCLFVIGFGAAGFRPATKSCESTNKTLKTDSTTENLYLKANLSVVSSGTDISPAAKSSQSKNATCSKKWLLLLTTGRSGSTTLMTILYSLPRMSMYGENDIRFLRSVVDSDRYHEPREDAWHKDESRMKEIIEAITSHIFAYYGYDNAQNDDYFGFKQLLPRIIREKESTYRSLKKLKLLSEYFPCARFIVNFRHDVKAQRASQFREWQGHAPSEKRLATWNEILSTFGKGRNDTFLLPLEEFSLEKLNELIKWLGYSECTLNSLPRVKKVTRLGFLSLKAKNFTNGILSCESI
mmetsp:Transcript_10793/g.16072  ORF Transcript_10793/g.16072 Transcript_10793/m.16072 type:complete len:316 (-) Transcript_10793:77-1024(-)